MAKSSKPRKKRPNQKLKQLKREIRLVTNASLMMQIHSLLSSGEQWVLNGRIIPKEQLDKMKEEYHLFFMTAHKWNVLGGVACRSPDGQNYFRMIQQAVLNEVNLFDPELQDFAYGLTVEALQKVNKDHLLSTFLFFSPESREFSEKETENLLNSVGTFERLITPLEFTDLKQRAENEIKAIGFDEVLPPREVNLLKPHFQNWWEIYHSQLGEMQKIKGIGEKREMAIIKKFTNYAIEHCPTFKEYGLRHGNMVNVTRFLEMSTKDCQGMYQKFLEIDKKVRKNIRKR